MTQPAVPDSHRDLFVGRAVSLSTLNARSFLAQLLVPYGHTLETFDTRINQAAEDRVVVTFHPTRVRTA